MKTIISPKNIVKKWIVHNKIILQSLDIRKKYKKPERNLQKGAIWGPFYLDPKICLQMLKLSLSKTKSQVFPAEPSQTFISNIN